MASQLQRHLRPGATNKISEGSPHQAPGVDPMLCECWDRVVDGCPALTLHCVSTVNNIRVIQTAVFSSGINIWISQVIPLGLKI